MDTVAMRAQMLEIGQGRSKALRDLLANYEEAKRGKVEAELQLSHAVDKIEELTEWKNLNSSRAIWDAVEARAEQAREDDEVSACVCMCERMQVWGFSLRTVHL
jgi:hypothetical protein